MLLRAAPPGSVVTMDWDAITFEYPIGSWRYRRVDLANPLLFSRAETEPVFRRHDRFDELLDALGAERLVPADSGNAWGRDHSGDPRRGDRRPAARRPGDRIGSFDARREVLPRGGNGYSHD
jgi:hypothetical protein